MKMNNPDIQGMKSNHFPWGILKFSVLLFLVMLLMLLYSYTGKEVRVMGVDIKQNTLSSFFTPVNGLFSYMGIRYQWKKDVEVDSTQQRILIAGDSMSGFLRLRLNDYCQQNGHVMYSVVWNSGNTIWFAETDTLDYFIAKFQPTYILIVLGGNELTLPHPEYRQKHIDKIIRKIGNIPYVWIGPPNWEEDTGINDMLLKSVGRKRFFPSLKLEFDRQSDGAHPTQKSAYIWMDSIAAFMMTKSKHPVLMEYPDTHARKHPPTSMLSPLRSGRESKELNTGQENENKSI
jgi:hypothetical protein